MKQYNTYRFRDKDPIIDRLRTIVADQGVTLKYIENKSGVTTWTLHQWFNGKTKRPMHCTIAAVAEALGYTLTFMKHGQSNVTPIHKRVRST